jgi:glycosyltransferase involved in cell wall biosynthesis
VAIAAASAVTAIIPCLDEEEAIGPVVDRLVRYGLAEIIVVDGGSQDRTVEVARAAGARVVHAPRRGYGLALRTGLAASSPLSRIVLFLDGDGSDPLEAIPALLQPIEQDVADFVMGSRLRGECEPGSLAPAQIFAGRLVGLLIWLRYGVSFSDMSPLRAIRRDVLDGLGMHAQSYGWNLEMQMRVAAQHRRILELPVGQKRRVGGRSKVSGSWPAALRATLVLATTFLRLALTPSAARGASPRRRGP